jgi:hypothetical protein
MVLLGEEELASGMIRCVMQSLEEVRRPDPH